MIIINLTGGLGNQMFQYSFGRYLAIKNNTELKYHFTNALLNTKREFELDVFNIKADKVTRLDLKKVGVSNNLFLNRVFYLLDEKFHLSFNKKTITENKNIDFIKNKKIDHDVYLQGFWQNDSFLNEIENVIRGDFSFLPPLDENNNNILNIIKSVNSVSVHVRRGDYLTNKANTAKYGFIGIDYYVNAIKNIEQSVKNPVFFIFSDDMEWCKNNLNFINEKYFVDWNIGKDSYKDMQLMSLCKHNIIANSTFSWWGSWLNNNKKKIIIKL